MTQRIRHTTTYRYRRAVALQPHRLLLTPRSDHDLAVRSATIACTPEAQLAWARDAFGNLVATATFAAPADRLVIASDIVIEQSAPAWPIFRIAPAAHLYPFRYSEDELTDLGALLAPRAADPGGAVAAWARRFVPPHPTDTLSLLRDINTACSATIAYLVRPEEGTQPPAETLAHRSGSCRDIAALFMDAVRVLGFGARAVSGYLLNPPVEGNEAGSTHAWAEVYLPEAGWITFDPTHGGLGSAHLVPVAVGRCTDQILPVTGGYAGKADDFLAMDVAVEVAEA